MITNIIMDKRTLGFKELTPLLYAVPLLEHVEVNGIQQYITSLHYRRFEFEFLLLGYTTSTARLPKTL